MVLGRQSQHHTLFRCEEGGREGGREGRGGEWVGGWVSLQS